jgi:acetyl esterase/lipase
MAYIVFIAIILLLSAWSLYITRREKRSFRSWGSEKLLQLRLKRGWFHGREDSERFLALQEVKNEQPFVMPTPLKLLAIVERRTIEGLDCVVLKERTFVGKTHILYLHGGAYVEHPILPHWLFLDRINNQVKGTIIVPIYPKAPVHTVLESFDKFVALYRKLIDDGIDAKDIVVMGDSAGGGLALALSQQLALDSVALPKEVILISPWLDITLRNAAIPRMVHKDPMLNRQHLQRMGKAWAGPLDPSDRKTSPINGQLRGLPRLSLFIGTHELLLPDARKLRLLCIRNGVKIDYFEYPKMNHDFPLFPIPEAKQALKEIVAIITRA